MSTSPLPQTEKSQAEKSDLFITRLEALKPGPLAKLRQNVGHSLADSHTAFPVFFRSLPEKLSYAQNERYFLIATLFALTKNRDRSDEAGSFGATLWRAARHNPSYNTNSLDRHFQTLIDSDHDQLAFHLGQMVRFSKSKYAQMDFRMLLGHVLAWDNPERWVQLRWAQDYYVGPAPKHFVPDLPTVIQL